MQDYPLLSALLPDKVKRTFEVKGWKKLESTQLAAIQAGFAKVDRALQVLFDPDPLVTHHAQGSIRTEFGPGFEALTVIEGKPNAEAMRTHRAKIDAHAQATLEGWKLAARVIAWGLAVASGPLSWLKLGTQMAELVKEFRDTPKND